MPGIFGDMFDFNNDGELDSFERAMEYQFLEDLEKEDEEADDWDSDDGDDDSDW